MKYIENDERPWGRFFVIQDESNYKIKRIEVEPGKTFELSISFKKSRSLDYSKRFWPCNY